MRTAFFDGKRRRSVSDMRHVKYYWSERIPTQPGTIEFERKKSQEQNYDGKFHLMASRDNDLKHKLEREYFDRPWTKTMTAYGSGFK